MITTSSAQDVCARITRRLADTVSQRKVDLWFPQAARLEYDSDAQSLDLAVPSQFAAHRIERQFVGEIQKAAAEELGHPVALKVQIRPDLFQRVSRSQTGSSPVSSRTTARSVSRRQKRRSPRRRYRLADFVVGSSNELAFAAAQSIVSNDYAAGPLFIHGGCGLGKTHLLQAVCGDVLASQPQARALYVTAEKFTNDFLTAMRNNQTDTFRRKMRRLDLLCIDDIHFIANKQATQQEFLHSFDAMELGGARVVLASDSHPKAIEQFSESLVSRCVRGLVVQIHPPDMQTRCRIIEVLAERRKLRLNPAAVQLLAARCIGSVRDIEGTLTKLQAMSTLMSRPSPVSSTRHQTLNAHGTGGGRAAHVPGGASEGVSSGAWKACEMGGLSGDEGSFGIGGTVIGPALVQQLFVSQQQSRTPRPIHIEGIIQVVCEQLALEPAQLYGAGRHRHVVLARAIIAHLARGLTPMSFPEIGRALKRASHSSIITATRRLQNQIHQHQTIIHPVTHCAVPIAEITERCRQAICLV